MPDFISIADFSDPRLDPYRNIRDRDLRGRGNAFIAEGQTVLQNALLRSQHAFLSVLISKSRLVKMETVLAHMPDDFPVYVATPDILDEIAGFHIHRGILAHGERSQASTVTGLIEQLPQSSLAVAAFGISNHDNLGGIFRNAAAFGADAVLLDAACCDPLYRKAIRVSVGASLICPFARATEGSGLLEELQAAGFDCLALTPAADCDLTAVRLRGSRVVLCVGAEGPGLPAEVIAGARSVSIAMARGFDSLNAATATGIALHAVATRMCRI